MKSTRPDTVVFVSIIICFSRVPENYSKLSCTATCWPKCGTALPPVAGVVGSKTQTRQVERLCMILPKETYQIDVTKIKCHR